jgi:hypothetical protein
MEKMPSMGNNKDQINEYIKIAEYLHPDLLNRLNKNGKSGNSLCFSAADLLMRYNHDIQIFIYNLSCSNGGVTKPNIEKWIKHYEYEPINNCHINSISRSITLNVNNQSNTSASNFNQNPSQSFIPTPPPIYTPSFVPFPTSNPFVSFDQYINDARLSLQNAIYIYGHDRNSIVRLICQ